MFLYSKQRFNRAASDLLSYARLHIGWLVFTLLGSSVATMALKWRTGADIWQEAWTVGAFGVVGPAAVFCMAFLVFWVRASGKIYRDLVAEIDELTTEIKRGSLTIKRDTPVAEAIAWVVFRSWGKTFFDAAESSLADGNKEFALFLQAAADGDVTVWGILDGASVYIPIPKEYWRTHSIDWFSALREDAHSQPNNPNDDTRESYAKLMTSKTEVERTWPRDMKSALRLGKPQIDTNTDDNGRPARVACTLPVTNRGPEILRECSVKVRSIECEGEVEQLESVVRTVARSHDDKPDRFKLSPGETKWLLITERDAGDVRRSPPHYLKIERGDKPLYRPNRYRIQLTAYSEVSDPEDRTIRVTVGDDANLAADLVA